MKNFFLFSVLVLLPFKFMGFPLVWLYEMWWEGVPHAKSLDSEIRLCKVLSANVHRAHGKDKLFVCQKFFSSESSRPVARWPEVSTTEWGWVDDSGETRGRRYLHILSSITVLIAVFPFPGQGSAGCHGATADAFQCPSAHDAGPAAGEGCCPNLRRAR